MLPAELEEPPRAHHRSRLTRRGRILLVVTILVVLAVVLGFGAVVVGKAVGGGGSGGSQDFSGTGSGRVVVEIKSGDSATAIANTLKEAGVVASTGAFLDAVNGDDRATSLQPGFYALHAKMSGASALALLLDPASEIRSRVTVPEGTSLKTLTALVAKGSKITAAQFEAVLANPSALGLPSYALGQPEGFLFPATYDVTPGETALALARQMVARFGTAAADVNLVRGAAALGRTPREVVIIASIIERESAAPTDAPKVARVFYNRLARGMPLGSEFTVRYAGNDPTNPYNTYTHTGFPPGPYDSPGEVTLRAALNPAPGDWLFFVTLKDGTHFTNSESEFNTLEAQCKAEGGCK